MNSNLTQQGFINEEQKKWAIKTLQSDGTGEFAPGGATGCNLDHLKEKTLIRFSNGNIDTPITHGLYPESVDLTAGINPLIFNQNPRGTCVGCATTALAQYYFGNNILLSPEYVFALHKQYQSNCFESAVDKFKARVLEPYKKSKKSFDVEIPEDLIDKNTFRAEENYLTSLCAWFKNLLLLKYQEKQETRKETRKERKG